MLNGAPTLGPQPAGQAQPANVSPWLFAGLRSARAPPPHRWPGQPLACWLLFLNPTNLSPTGISWTVPVSTEARQASPVLQRPAASAQTNPVQSPVPPDPLLFLCPSHPKPAQGSLPRLTPDSSCGHPRAPSRGHSLSLPAGVSDRPSGSTSCSWLPQHPFLVLQPLFSFTSAPGRGSPNLP